MRSVVSQQQKPFLSFLDKETSHLRKDFLDSDSFNAALAIGVVERFWINNAITVRVTPWLLERILKRSDVSHVELVRYADIEDLKDTSTFGRRPRHIRSSSPPPLTAPLQATWSVNQVNAPKLWSLGITGEGVVVAVLDTGVNYRHGDLMSRMWDGGHKHPHHGWDFFDNDDDPMDEDSDGHGTCCAGIIAGDGSLGKATGVAPSARIMALRVAGAARPVAENDYWRGFTFALANGAHIISMSMSWKHPRGPDYPGWRRVCDSVLAAGKLHVNSTGNQGNNLSTYPIPFNTGAPGNCPPPRMHRLQVPRGGLSSTISCGNTDEHDRLDATSARGPCEWFIGPYLDYPYQGGIIPGLIKPDVCAPGSGSLSCNHMYVSDPTTDPYRKFGGSSAATPHVAGCLALLAHACLRSNNPIVPTRMLEALEETAVRITGQTVDKENHYGAGRVDVFEAYLLGESRGWWK